MKMNNFYNLENLTGEAKLKLLLSKDCPNDILSLFEIGDLKIKAKLQYDQVPYSYYFNFEEYNDICVKGVGDGYGYCFLKMSKLLVPYFISTLQDDLYIQYGDPFEGILNIKGDVVEGYGRTPSTNAFINLVYNYSGHLLIVEEEGKSNYWEAPPRAEDIDPSELIGDLEASLNLQGKVHKIYSDQQDDRWSHEDSSTLNLLKELAIKFFDSYKEGELNWDADCDGSGVFQFDDVIEFQLQNKGQANSGEFISSSTEEIIQLSAKLSSNSPIKTGVLINIRLNNEEIDSSESPEKSLARFTEFCNILTDKLPILGVDNPEKVELLVQKKGLVSIGADYESMTLQIISGCKPNIRVGHLEPPRTSLQSIYLKQELDDIDFDLLKSEFTWRPLQSFLEDIQKPGEIKDNFLLSLQAKDSNNQFEETFVQISLRMTSELPFLKGNIFHEFLPSICDDLKECEIGWDGICSISQCILAEENNYISLVQSYNSNGDLGDGIMKYGFCNGYYSNNFSTLKGTVWEGLVLR